MGMLDAIFGGSKGISATLHKTLGGTATIRVANYSRNEATGILSPTYVEYQVPFVPNPSTNARAGLNAPSASRSDVREPEGKLSGTFPLASLPASIKPERDVIVYGGIEYTIETVERLNVGNVGVQYSITARRD